MSNLIVDKTKVSGIEQAIRGLRNIKIEFLKIENGKIYFILEGKNINIYKSYFKTYIDNMTKKDSNISKLKNPIHSFKFGYYVGECGNIVGKNGNIMKPSIGRDGYYHTQINGKNFDVHRFICMNFKPIDDYKNKVVNHIDGNKLNNSIENLEWCTYSDNSKHSINNKLQIKSGNQYGTYQILNKEQRDLIRQLRLTKTIKEVSKIIGVSEKTVKKYQYKGGDDLSL